METNANLTFVYGITGVVVTWLIVTKILDYTTPNLDFIPSVGPSGRLTSYAGAIRFLTDGRGMIREGIDKYKGAMFKVPFMDKWVVIVSTPQMIDDVRQAREEDLSFRAAVDEGIQARYTLGIGKESSHYHIHVVRAPLTRNLAARFPDIYDEIVKSFNDVIPLKDNDWTSVPALTTMMQIVCRTSNRFFIGLPLCRDPDYCDLNIRFTVDIVKAAQFINLFPRLLHPIIGRVVSPLPRTTKRALRHLEPLISERLKLEAASEKEEEHNNDLISWLLEEAPEEEKMLPGLMRRILLVNFAAIHTSSHTFTHALYQLAANPQYIEPMREEIESIVKQDGWTKSAMGKMRKVDSFLRETQRYIGLSCLVMQRSVMKPSGFTFSDGTTLPKGSMVAVSNLSAHYDETRYPNPLEFNGFRFSDLREEDGEGIKHQMVNTNVDYIPFGHGRHACPGRFFAANELKTMLAHLIVNYDIKLADASIPPLARFGATSIPNRTAHVMFRKRQ